ncbi:MAG: hypothetical protein FJ087_22840 [Deltaproteobacteria bacterium]|nr:hypothetical protein [Deltaproteobacteria bacterium]
MIRGLALLGALVRRLQFLPFAAAAVAVAAAEGCLWAPDVSERPEDDGPTSLITLDRSKVRPPPDVTYLFTDTTTFSVAAAVVRLDGQRPVYSWFVDYVESEASRAVAYYPRDSDTLVINPCAPTFKTLYGFHEGGFHHLELFASTEPIQVDELTGERLIPADHVYVHWYLDLRKKCPGSE